MAKPRRKLTIAEIFALGWPIDEALRKASVRALRWHQWIGTPIPTWDGEMVVWVDPRSIPLPEDEAGKPERKPRKVAARKHPTRKPKARRRH